MTSPKNVPYEQARDGNQAWWDELTPVHLRSYGMERFLAGGPWLPKEILSEVGDVSRRSLLHLQCHFGLDSLAWVRQGAEVTGVDFSPAAIEAARELAQIGNLSARFVCADIYDLQNHLEGQFDLVFTSIGVLCWLKDLDEWARTITHFLKPGGFFYIMDAHPLLYTFDDEGTWQFILPYFHNPAPYNWEDEEADYMDDSYKTSTPTYEWQWPISDIINAVLRAGLRLEFFHEYEALSEPVYPQMKPREDGLFTFPGMPVPLPVVFSLKAHKAR